MQARELASIFRGAIVEQSSCMRNAPASKETPEVSSPVNALCPFNKGNFFMPERARSFWAMFSCEFSAPVPRNNATSNSSETRAREEWKILRDATCWMQWSWTQVLSEVRRNVTLAGIETMKVAQREVEEQNSRANTPNWNNRSV